MKIKVFKSSNPAGEEAVNQWLAEHDQDVQIVNMFTNAVANSDGKALLLITVIYRELQAPQSPDAPPVFK
jgi:hypothetical protein